MAGKTPTEPTYKPPPQDHTIRINSRKVIDDIIRDLRSAAKRSARTGGIYTVFIPGYEPFNRVRLEIQLH